MATNIIQTKRNVRRLMLSTTTLLMKAKHVSHPCVFIQGFQNAALQLPQFLLFTRFLFRKRAACLAAPLGILWEFLRWSAWRLVVELRYCCFRLCGINREEWKKCATLSFGGLSAECCQEFSCVELVATGNPTGNSSIFKMTISIA